MAKSLDVGEGLLRRWRDEFSSEGDSAFAGSGKKTGLEEENRTLRAEVWLVLWVSIAAAGLRALLSLVDSLTKGTPLRQQAWVNALRQYLQLLAGAAVVEGVALDAADSPLVQ